MKRIIILAIAAITLTTTNVQAQNWLNALKGVATSAIDKVTGGKLTANALYGTWSYNQPGIKLSSSTNALSDLTATAATSTLQTKMATYYEKVGIKAGACSFTFNEDGTFKDTLISSESNRGAYVVQDKTIHATYTNDKNMRIEVTEWDGGTPSKFNIQYGDYTVYFG